MKRATVRTTHDDPDLVAAAVAPDNTASMDTRVEGDHVVTTIQRETTGGLQSTVDDYVVNCSVAERAAAAAGSSSGIDQDEQRANHDQTNDT
ncbi:hypothetical protein BRC81_09445 [Halobacteriales archaeon QS_1_68_20]|nr:MAG: hypothetical protein BRC81_09445 [Halobacteriales archaeon QS_1_68_20]